MYYFTLISNLTNNRNSNLLVKKESIMPKTIITQHGYNPYISPLVESADITLIDIDDVILTTPQFACSTQWYGRFRAANKDILSSSELASQVNKCFSSTNFTAVSSEFNDYFSNYAQNHLVIGLTARKATNAAETSAQLLQVQMRFSQNIMDNYYLKNGIIYVDFDMNTVSPNDKGKVLAHLLEQGAFGEDIHSINFIDDSKKNLDNVKNALGDEYDFIGIHYIEVQSKLTKAFSEVELEIIGEYQLRYFNSYGIFPSNEHALTLFHQEVSEMFL